MIAEMKLINLTANEEYLQVLLQQFATFKGFHPADTSQILSTVHGAKPFDDHNPCDELLQEISEIEDKVGYKFSSEEITELKDPIDEMHQYIVAKHEVFRQKLLEAKNLEDDIDKYKEALLQVENLEGIDLSFDDLFHTKFVSLRFGKLPIDIVDRLRFYKHKPFIFVPFHEDKTKGELWCLYLTSNEYEREIDNLFTSMYFERVYIPDFVHGTSKDANLTLTKMLNDSKEKLDNIHKELASMAENCNNDFCRIKGELVFLRKVYEARRYVVGLGDRIAITGFIEKSRIEELKTHFENVPTVDVDVRPANSDKRLKPPTKLKNNWFTRPFQMFVEMYGIPSYSDIDPTTFVAITYSLLFGIMFGDFGQGLVLALIGFLLGKYKKMAIGPIITRIGFAGAFFGLIYGETFGDTAFLEPLYSWLSNILGITIHPIHPMEASITMKLLIGTVAIGAVIIITAITVNTITKLKHKDYAEGLFSSNGLSGLLFYGFILIGILLQVGLGFKNVFNPVTIIVFLVLPILLIFFKEPISRRLAHQELFPDGVGGFIIEGIFELFEVLLSYLTNTLSFLRVGGFVLSHAGMMLVVKTLMEMSSGAGSVVVAIIGNLFVMSLEGLIVGIQVLRLEFYEMFSRYFDGDGTVFNPIF